jgi:transcriptional regulator with PAS, ATPase and Fis domain
MSKPDRLTPEADHVSAAPLRLFAPADARDAERLVLNDSGTGDVRHLIACSGALLEVLEKAKRIARSKVPVLIQGETGTGKELLARLIHDSSSRRARRFLPVNCAAFSESLVESELFGHEKGAFTGAEQRHLGCFERADQGSLLLDEIGEMPLSLQAKLLRVLEEETFDRVGGEQSLKVDVRLIATTNRDLEQEMALGQFRRDLFYRLNAMPLQVPALRTRLQDIPPLVRFFIEQYGDQGAVRVTDIARRALDSLLGYSWPGNVRQLRNVIHHACVLARGACIETGDLPPLREAAPMALATGSKQTLAEIERQIILDTLREVGGNRTAAALRLGVTVRTLQNKLKRYREEAA